MRNEEYGTPRDEEKGAVSMMTDAERREMVVDGLMACLSNEKCEECPYVDYGICTVQLRDDALYLLQTGKPRGEQKEG